MINKESSVEEIKECILYSEDEKQPYRIMIAKPKKPAPAEGYPIIYTLDGNAFFQTFQDAVRIQSVRPDVTGVEPAIVIGIGYPDERDFIRERRFYDFTPTPVQSNPLNEKKWPKTGGAYLFLEFIEGTVKPYLNQYYSINLNKQTLFGHSLGGLFSLYVLFTKTNVFQNYIIGSPSIWWNEKEILNEESTFLSSFKNMDESVRVLIFVGSLEKDYMVTDARELYQRLIANSNKNIVSQFIELNGENHLSVVLSVISSSLRFLNHQKCCI
ncbi:alpha/beta hydrolase [Lysinibacillus sp. NPDC096418]|uniref:alpha/beta hydrolase n=1 Tax=Lysinibacillus sp. NPDC096418 TaxID=3364138 RepID=UPI0037FA3D48